MMSISSGMFEAGLARLCQAGRWLWLVLLACVIAGCAAPQRIAGEPGEAFERTGRFALTVDTPQGQTEAIQGGFAWRDDGHTLLLDLSNPVGSVLARLRVQPNLATLERSNGERESATNPDLLAARVLGEAIPVAGLRHWLQGRSTAAANAPSTSRSTDQQSFQENGWQVVLSRFDDQGPRLLRLTWQDAGRRVHMRIVVNESEHDTDTVSAKP